MSTRNKTLPNLMWVERYRPVKLEQVIDQKEIVNGLRNLIKNPYEIPHLLFAGPAGVGKTTAALCIARELLGEEWQRNTLELNASDERGIKMVRERVKEFAAVMKLATGNKDDMFFRIIILKNISSLFPVASFMTAANSFTLSRTILIPLSSDAFSSRVFLCHSSPSNSLAMHRAAVVFPTPA